MTTKNGQTYCPPRHRLRICKATLSKMFRIWRTDSSKSVRFSGGRFLEADSPIYLVRLSAFVSTAVRKVSALAKRMDVLSPLGERVRLPIRNLVIK